MLRKPFVLLATETSCRNLQKDYRFSGDLRAVQELDVILVHILKVSQLILWNVMAMSCILPDALVIKEMRI